ncbi:Rieske (2Fe-2S) protein [Myroides indicus]|uniref:Nitrite reductase/ring-hydroxylating ferredoxin subunit n=1 Tax=Myroides indicus TaxID=1323422 RepID=A0A4R7ERS5_9FLAO|nr:hypothetical protein [Myroides indicus]TDS55919.1 hypothetical protein C8P70_12139 [Myroides indicus]
MKKVFVFIIILFASFSCSKSGGHYTNPYLPSNPVNLTIDLNLPAYDDLRYANGSAVINMPNQGVLGVVIFNLGSDLYAAYDIACPNHKIEPCSSMTLDKRGSIYMSCHCSIHPEPLKYSLITGTSMTEGAEYQMKPYPVTKRGNIISVNY